MVNGSALSVSSLASAKLVNGVGDRGEKEGWERGKAENRVQG